MKPRFVGRVGPADVVTAVNAALGFTAVVMAGVDLELAARLVLVAAIADGADGIIAKRYGGTPVGEYLDGLADVASFGVAPATIVFWFVWGSPLSEPVRLVLGIGIPALFVIGAVVRLALYTAYDVEADQTLGVQSTLAAVVLGAAVLGGADYRILLAAMAILTYLMVTSITYPDLLPRDALIMGSVQALAVLVPEVYGNLFPLALLVCALAYLSLAPRFYWRRE